MKLRNTIIILISIFFLMIVVFLFFKLDPTKSNIFPPCIFYKLTGLYCPGCGTQRAVHEFLHGNFFKSFRYNPMPFLMLLLLSLFFIFNKYKKYTKSNFTGQQSWFIVILIIAYFIARNLPFLPFLAP